MNAPDLDKTPFMFNGVDDPKSNYFRFPMAVFDHLREITSMSEMIVLMYIIRHTWGYGDDEKKLTTNEFIEGRKRKNGTRMDQGTGLSKPSVIDGLKRAEKHGFIYIDVNNKDKARIEKTYGLRRAEMSNSFTPDVNILDINGKESLHRTEIDTLEETLDTSSRKPRKQDELFNALRDHLLNGNIGTTIKAKKKLKESFSAATGDEIPHVIAFYKAKYPTLALPGWEKFPTYYGEWLKAGKPGLNNIGTNGVVIHPDNCPGGCQGTGWIETLDSARKCTGKAE